MDKAMNPAINPKHIGDDFERRFSEEAATHGLYLQHMASRDGFDFLIGPGPMIVELKCVAKNRLRLNRFTPIEIITAEAMTKRGVDYNIVFPLFGTFGVITWGEIRDKLFTGGITLDSPFHRKFFEEIRNGAVS